MTDLAAIDLMNADELRRSAFVPHSVPFAIARAEGSFLYTPEGRPILDAAGGAIVANIGWGREEVAEAAAQSLRTTTYVVPPFATEERLRLTQRLTGHWLPEGITRSLIVSGGSESVDAAIRLARQYHVASGRPERWKVISTDLSYHGVTLGALSAGGHADRRAGFEPLLIPFPKAPHPYSLEGSLGRVSPDPRRDAADALEALILAEGPETVAAYIGEPVTGASGGAVVPPDDYWPRVAEICKRYDVLLIADEVMTGFGRTGRNFGVELWGVTPDIMTGGKGLSGGYAPMGGVYATQAVVAPLAERGEDLMFFTFSAHPAACAAADKVLEIMEREDLVARAERMGDLLRERLRHALGEHPNVAEVRGRGLLNAIELVQDRDTLTRFPKEDRFAQRVISEAMRRGVFFYKAGTGPVHDAVLMGPAFTISEDEIDLLVNTLADALDAVASA